MGDKQIPNFFSIDIELQMEGTKNKKRGIASNHPIPRSLMGWNCLFSPVGAGILPLHRYHLPPRPPP